MTVLTEEQQLIRDNVRRLAQGKVAPRAAEIDRTEEYPQDMFELLRDQGLLRLPFPVEYGGLGAGIMTTCVAVEELARVCYNTAYIMIITYAPFAAILHAGTDDQKNRYLRGLAEGRLRGSVANTEPEAGSDSAAIQTRAILRDGAFILDGTKVFVTNALIADFIVVTARLSDEGVDHGITAFIVPTDASGLEVGRADHKIGGRGIPTSEVRLESCRVPVENLLGKKGDGQRVALATFARARPVQGSRGVGLAQGALDYAVAYARERHQFGRPLASFQGLQFMMADMAIQIEAGRQLTYHAATLMDGAKPTAEALAIAAMCKCFCAEMAMQVAVNATQILGGYGMVSDFPLERFLRDAKLLSVVGGTSQIQRIVIARHLLGRDVVQ